MPSMNDTQTREILERLRSLDPAEAAEVAEELAEILAARLDETPEEQT